MMLKKIQMTPSPLHHVDQITKSKKRCLLQLKENNDAQTNTKALTLLGIYV